MFYTETRFDNGLAGVIPNCRPDKSGAVFGPSGTALEPYRFREVRRYRCQASSAKTNAATEVSRQINPEIRAVMVVGRCEPPVWKNTKPEMRAPILVRAHHTRQVIVHRATSLNSSHQLKDRAKAGFRKVADSLKLPWTRRLKGHDVAPKLASLSAEAWGDGG